MQVYLPGKALGDIGKHRLLVGPRLAYLPLEQKQREYDYLYYVLVINFVYVELHWLYIKKTFAREKI